MIGLASASETQQYLDPCFNGVYVPDLLYEPLVVRGTGPRGIEDEIARHERAHHAMRLALTPARARSARLRIRE